MTTTVPLLPPEEGVGRPPAQRSRAERAREQRLRAAVAAAEEDLALLGSDEPVRQEPRVQRLRTLRTELAAAGEELADADAALSEACRRYAGPGSEGAALGAQAFADLQEARSRLQAARVALGAFQVEDADHPFTDPAWRRALAGFREAGRQESRRAAEDAQALVELAGAVPRRLGDTRGATAWRSFLRELAVARSWSEQRATTEVHRARVLVEDLPRTHAALGAGLLALGGARALVDVALEADADVRWAVDALALDAVGLSAWRTAQQARKALLQADPEAAARRAARSRRDRSVSLRPMSDERVEISVVGPAVPGTQAFAALDADARALRRAGDPRTLQQLRFDLFLQRCLAGHVLTAPTSTPGSSAGPTSSAPAPVAAPGPVAPVEPVRAGDAASTSDPAPLGTAVVADGLVEDDPRQDDPRQDEPLQEPAPDLAAPPDPTAADWLTDRRLSRNVRVEITVPVTTARGLDDEPGWLAGYGWISAPTVRQLLPAAELRQLCVAAGGQAGAGSLVDRDPHLRRPAPPDLPAELERMMTDPFAITPTAWQAQPQHDPSPALAALVRARDRFDDGPTQPRVRAEHADLDHDQPHGAGGPTAAWNLVSRGRATHLHKHGRWTATRTPDGTLWRSPAGQLAFTPRWSSPPPRLRARSLPDPHQVHRRDSALLRSDQDDGDDGGDGDGQ